MLSERDTEAKHTLAGHRARLARLKRALAAAQASGTAAESGFASANTALAADHARVMRQYRELQAQFRAFEGADSARYADLTLLHADEAARQVERLRAADAAISAQLLGGDPAAHAAATAGAATRSGAGDSGEQRQGQQGEGEDPHPPPPAAWWRQGRCAPDAVAEVAAMLGEGVSDDGCADEQQQQQWQLAADPPPPSLGPLRPAASTIGYGSGSCGGVGVDELLAPHGGGAEQAAEHEAPDELSHEEAAKLRGIIAGIVDECGPALLEPQLLEQAAVLRSQGRTDEARALLGAAALTRLGCASPAHVGTLIRAFDDAVAAHAWELSECAAAATAAEQLLVHSSSGLDCGSTSLDPAIDWAAPRSVGGSPRAEDGEEEGEARQQAAGAAVECGRGGDATAAAAAAVGGRASGWRVSLGVVAADGGEPTAVVTEMRLPLTLAVTPILASWQRDSKQQQQQQQQQQQHPATLHSSATGGASEAQWGGRTGASLAGSSSCSSSTAPSLPAGLAAATSESTVVVSDEAAFWQSFTQAIPPERIGVWRALDRGLQAYRGELERRAELNRQVGALRQTTQALRQSLSAMLSDPANGRMLQPPVLAAVLPAGTSITDLLLLQAAAAPSHSGSSTGGGTDPSAGTASTCGGDDDVAAPLAEPTSSSSSSGGGGGGGGSSSSSSKWGANRHRLDAPAHRAPRGHGGGMTRRGKPGSALSREQGSGAGSSSSDGRLTILGKAMTG